LSAIVVTTHQNYVEISFPTPKRIVAGYAICYAIGIPLINDDNSYLREQSVRSIKVVNPFYDNYYVPTFRGAYRGGQIQVGRVVVTDNVEI